ncbi:hypothetical protein GO495_22115 [Chitinophaga oryziterrae]|uniref:Uncharacterized protein n=1 Tax=Chitinophaga oryziterrae TaxID=1031224 RepID=A0A6N8JDL3_9BACT|nr:hypothetical protein [Chitinophaga oryziterrae]MVT43310.1 hypothetical protein [Chitinophaga oryziterrae]
MSHSKYEIRSSQVQEVLSKPPGFITLWGNTLIFLLLIAALLWVFNLQLQVRQTVPCTIESLGAGSSGGRETITIVSSSQLQMPKERKILLILNRDAGMEKPIACTVDRMWSQEGNSYLLISYDSHLLKEMKIARNMTGKIKLETPGAESGFEMLKRKILLR